jgi:hypothetical protein
VPVDRQRPGLLHSPDGLPRPGRPPSPPAGPGSPSPRLGCSIPAGPVSQQAAISSKPARAATPAGQAGIAQRLHAPVSPATPRSPPGRDSSDARLPGRHTGDTSSSRPAYLAPRSASSTPATSRHLQLPRHLHQPTSFFITAYQSWDALSSDRYIL